MLKAPTTVKRLAMALLGACLLLLGTPLLTGITPASAAAPSGPVALSFFANRAATDARQVFSNIDANLQYVVVNASNPGPGYDPVASMQFSLTDTVTGITRQMSTLTAAPWRFGINPTDGVAERTQTLTFTALNANSIALASITMSAVFRAFANKIAITAPTGNVITVNSANQLTFSGTTSTTFYGVTVANSGFAIRPPRSRFVGIFLRRQ